MMKIGLWGLDFGSENLGCGALSYSFLHMLDCAAGEKGANVSVCVFTQEKCRIDRSFCTHITDIEIVEYHLKKIPTMIQLLRKIKECSMIYDFTSGDSFSDIYGSSRVLKSELLKTIVLLSGTKLVLGPQTYGPFANTLPRNWAKWILRRADVVYARDDISADYVKELTGRDAARVIDVAFALPYHREEPQEHPLQVGINVSGLLWNGGYTKDNQFGLRTDYQQYCMELVRWLKSMDAKVHLIGHVLSESVPVEDDLHAAQKLNERCGGKCVIAPRFATPMEAKRYIAGMDVFVGARMHSTIAAISSGCATIPFAYSRKFKGLYQTLDYPYVVEACEIKTDEALRLTQEWILDRAELTRRACASGEIAREKLDSFSADLEIKLISREEAAINT